MVIKKGKNCLKPDFSCKNHQEYGENRQKDKLLVQPVMIRQDYGFYFLPFVAYGKQGAIPCFKNFILFQGTAEEIHALQGLPRKNSVPDFQGAQLFAGLDQA